MASGRGLQMIYGPGELFINPTNIAGAAYGSGLGYTNDGVLIRPSLRTSRLNVDERGVEGMKEIIAGADWTLASILVQWTADVIGQLFPGMAASGGGHAYRKAVKLGSAMPMVKLLFVPEDTTNTPAVYFRKAVGRIEESANIRIALGSNPKASMFPVVFSNMSGVETGTGESGLGGTVQIRPLASIIL